MYRSTCNTKLPLAIESVSMRILALVPPERMGREDQNPIDIAIDIEAGMRVSHFRCHLLCRKLDEMHYQTHGATQGKFVAHRNLPISNGARVQL